MHCASSLLVPRLLHHGHSRDVLVEQQESRIEPSPRPEPVPREGCDQGVQFPRSSPVLARPNEGDAGQSGANPGQPELEGLGKRLQPPRGGRDSGYGSWKDPPRGGPKEGRAEASSCPEPAFGSAVMGL